MPTDEEGTAPGSYKGMPGPVDADAVAGQVSATVEDVSARRGKPRFGTTTPRGGAPPDGRIVEVQFRPGATGLAAALASNAIGFLEETDFKDGRSDGLAVRTVLLRHQLVESRPSFAQRFIRAEEERLAESVAAGEAALPDSLAGLPSLQNFVRLQFPSPEAAADAARDLRLLPEVEKAVLVPRTVPPTVPPPPTDPFIGTPEQNVTTDPITQHQPQWYLHRTSVLDAWELGARGAGVVIADLDWGFLTSHPDLAPRLEMDKAFNAIDHDDVVDEGTEIGHGTAVLGIAGAAGDGAGMSGYAPEASLWPIQAAVGGRPGADDRWHDAIEYVIQEDSGGRRKVIIVEAQTAALGSCEQIPSIHAAIVRAIAHDVVVCVAAGNGDKAAELADDGVRRINSTGSILVGATSWAEVVNGRWKESNWGPGLVVSAPGDPLHDVTCWEDGHYTDGFGGTSGAAAKVAGVAALMLSVNPTLSHAHIREILQVTGTPMQPDPLAPEKQAGVFLDAAAAVREALRRPGARHVEATLPTLGTAP